MSLTYIGIYVIIISAILKAIGVKLGDEEITSFVTIGLQVVGAGVAAYGRWRHGDVSVVGVKEPPPPPPHRDPTTGRFS